MGGPRFTLVVKDGELVSQVTHSAAEFLRQQPRGAYTTVRTVGQGSLLPWWPQHLARLAQSTQLMSEEGLMVEILKHQLEGLVLDGMRMALRVGREVRKDLEELMLTVLICSGDSKAAGLPSVSIHVANYLPAASPTPIEVAVMGPGRGQSAMAKDSHWATARQPLEASKPSSAQEVILSSDGNALLEGLVTNLFVVRTRPKSAHPPEEPPDPPQSSTSPLPAGTPVERGACSAVAVQSGVQRDDWDVATWRDTVVVSTAPLDAGVLSGVVRQEVLQLLKDAGVCIEEETPWLTERSEWTEAFLTSSVRLAQPISAVHVSGDSPKQGPSGQWESPTKWIRWPLPQACGPVAGYVLRTLKERARRGGALMEEMLLSSKK